VAVYNDLRREVDSMARDSNREGVIYLLRVLEDEFILFHGELPPEYLHVKDTITRKHTKEIKDVNERE